MKRYCPDCGSPTEYSIKKPIFCSSCGNSFEKNIAIPVQKNKPINQQAQVQKPIIAKKINIPNPDLDLDDSDYEEDIQVVPEISDIQIESYNEQNNKGVKLKDLMGTETNPIKKQKNKLKIKKASKKQILEDFAKEAGSLRKKK
jgi:hypothetical protein